MEGEFLDRQDVISFTRETRSLTKAGEVASAWRESLRRISRAQSLLWNETPISVRQALLARVDRESDTGKKAD